MNIAMKLVYRYITIFFTFSPTSNHVHPLQVKNCDSNSQLVVDEDDNVNSGLKGLRVNKYYVNENWFIHSNKDVYSIYIRINLVRLASVKTTSPAY